MHLQIRYTSYGIFGICSYLNFTTVGGLFGVRFLFSQQKGSCCSIDVFSSILQQPLLHYNLCFSGVSFFLNENHLSTFTVSVFISISPFSSRESKTSFNFSSSFNTAVTFEYFRNTRRILTILSSSLPS